MGILIRSAAETDVPAIAELENECFSCPRDAGAIGRGIGGFLIAEEDGRFLGYIDCAVILDEGYIGNIAVTPENRGRGIGDALLKRLIASAKSEKLAFLTLEVRESNTPARSLYEKNGFTVAAVHRNYYEKPREAAILMTIYFENKEG